ncbi:probable xyloglucan galactosyltransferase GT14 [Carya illinoinensis]|uniref:probable xyloglucan galactosyltransferase GT14 n=1 Tax=Carya illinoinensis TaxID=32201 RepID=UPI001C7213B3|nr:probable xyloglucan galactosyltransferase GT14 [Carya illinoinensis]
MVVREIEKCTQIIKRTLQRRKLSLLTGFLVQRMKKSDHDGVDISLSMLEPVASLSIQESKSGKITKDSSSGDGMDVDSQLRSCSGRYIYVYDLPSRFNEDLLKHRRSLSNWTVMCLFTSNMGLGPHLPSFGRFIQTPVGLQQTNYL